MMILPFPAHAAAAAATVAIAALADRVAKERGEEVGKVVGYSIHANRSTSRLTRLTFCTTGILIRRLMVDPELASVTHVIIDEVHERGLEVGMRNTFSLSIDHWFK